MRAYPPNGCPDSVHWFVHGSNRLFRIADASGTLRSTSRTGGGGTALTDVIQAELISALQSGADVEDVLRRYAGSKGPLYAALARATAQATEDLGAVQTRLRGARSQAKAEADRASAAGSQANEADKRARLAEGRLAKAEMALRKSEGSLAAVATLEAQGLDAKTLSRLGDVLAEASKMSGASPAAVVADLLKAAEAHRDVALAAAAAHAVEAQLGEREMRAKVRTAAVDVAEWLVREKVTRETVLAWRAIAQSLNGSDGSVAEAVADAIRRVGPPAMAQAAAERDLVALAKEQARLKTENDALRAEQDKVRAALTAVAQEGSASVGTAEEQATVAIAAARDQAIRSVRAVEAALTTAVADADGRVASVVERYRTLAEDAGRLDAQVAFARALASDDTEDWRPVRPREWAMLLRHLNRWLATTGSDPAAPRVEVLAADIANRLRYGSLYGAPRLSDIATWLVEGLLRHGTVGASPPPP